MAASKYKGIRNAGSAYTCTCRGATGGSVRGSGLYTRDSSICKAAAHSGAIGAGGGDVTVQPAKGCGKYIGTSKNGVTTSNWGSYDGSFFFKGRGAACAK